MQQTELELVDPIVPASPPRGLPATLQLTDLPEVLVKPAKSLVRSIKRYGVFEPIVVLDAGDDGYRILAGDRRTAAAREAGLNKIPALVFDADDVKAFESILKIGLNELRAANPAHNFDAVVDLAVNKRVPESVIARSTGLTVPTVRGLLGMTSVNKDILDGMRQGKVKFSVVRQLSKLPSHAQNALAMTLGIAGTITARDVKSWYITPKPQIVLREQWLVTSIGQLRLMGVSAPDATHAHNLANLLVDMMEDLGYDPKVGPLQAAA